MKKFNRLFNEAMHGWSGTKNAEQEGPRTLDLIKQAWSHVQRVGTYKEYGARNIEPLKNHILADLKELYSAVQDAMYGNNKVADAYSKQVEDNMQDEEGEEYVPGEGWRKIGSNQ